MNSTFTDELFFQYATCPDWIWQDRYGDLSQKGSMPDLVVKIHAEGVPHQNDFLSQLSTHKVTSVGIEGVKETRRLMEEGVEWIRGGWLAMEREGTRYQLTPSLLQRRRGHSRLGEYYYVPVSIRSSAEIKQTHWQLLALYSEALDVMQGRAPFEVGIVNNVQELLWMQLQEVHTLKTRERVTSIVNIMQGSKPPLRLTSRCRNSPWYETCVQECQQADDIALVYQLEGATMQWLRAQGINTVSSLANLEIMEKRNLLSTQTANINIGNLHRAQLQAKSLASDAVLWRNVPTIPESPIELFFDIEGDSVLQINYLLGVLVRGDTERALAHTGRVQDIEHSADYYLHFLATSPQEEDAMWDLFVQWLGEIPLQYCSIFHFSPYEKMHLKQLAEGHAKAELIKKVATRLVDVSTIIQRSVIFPIYFYSLKDIATSQCIQYAWQEPKANGAQSVFWYEQWLESGNREVLDKIVQYNLDDVQALAAVLDWLQRYTPKEVPENGVELSYII